MKKTIPQNRRLLLIRGRMLAFGVVPVVAVVAVVGYLLSHQHIKADTSAGDGATDIVLSANPPLGATINFKGQMCESYGAYCLNSGDFSIGDDIVGGLRGHSRTVKWVPEKDGGTFCWNGTCYKRGVLSFPTQYDRCVATPYERNSFTVVDHCSGINGVNWAIDYSTHGHLVFISDYNTTRFGQLYVLSGTNDGGLWSAEPYRQTGYFQKFDFE